MGQGGGGELWPPGKKRFRVGKIKGGKKEGRKLQKKRKKGIKNASFGMVFFWGGV